MAKTRTLGDWIRNTPSPKWPYVWIVVGLNSFQPVEEGFGTVSIYRIFRDVYPGDPEHKVWDREWL